MLTRRTLLAATPALAAGALLPLPLPARDAHRPLHAEFKPALWRIYDVKLDGQHELWVSLGGPLNENTPAPTFCVFGDAGRKPFEMDIIDAKGNTTRLWRGDVRIWSPKPFRWNGTRHVHTTHADPKGQVLFAHNDDPKSIVPIRDLDCIMDKALPGWTARFGLVRPPWNPKGEFITWDETVQGEFADQYRGTYHVEHGAPTPIDVVWA